MTLPALLTSDRDVKLARQIVGGDLHPAEFDQFIHMCKQYGLDPLRRQIYVFVFNKNNAQKRSVVYVTAIDGYRAIAQRSGNYRPGERSSEQSDEAIDKLTNPRGIVSATASVWQFAHDDWHEVKETVYWDEFAPLKEIWENNKPTGKFLLDPKKEGWHRMPRVMLQKCAEAQALRRGWPDALSDLYVQEEVDRSQMIDITPSEAADRAESSERMERLGGPSLTVDWCDGEPLQSVPVGKFHDAVMAYVKDHCEDDPERIGLFASRNTAALNELWAHDKNAALDLKATLDIYRRVREAAE